MSTQETSVDHGICPWVRTLVMRKSWWGGVLGRLWMVFLGGTGKGKRKLQGMYSWVVFTGRHESPNGPFYVVYYISGASASANDGVWSINDSPHGLSALMMIEKMTHYHVVTSGIRYSDKWVGRCVGTQREGSLSKTHLRIVMEDPGW
jgi:hypothetical protein